MSIIFLEFSDNLIRFVWLHKNAFIICALYPVNTSSCSCGYARLQIGYAFLNSSVTLKSVDITRVMAFRLRSYAFFLLLECFKKILI